MTTITNPSQEEIKNILTDAKWIAVVGLSDDPYRTSYSVSQAMQDAGYKIIPVNPKVDEVLGEKAVPSLSHVEGPIDIINVFRRSEFVPEIAQEAADTDAKVFWTQLGVVSEEGYETIKESGKTVVMDRCIKVEHSRM
ncbi:putative CoA-binding protein [Geomicrobium halophilum]|uniref:Putative CoA-binding protein n=1 Tax=Geomicrobium halophilum TaxID=549000 RepID=A0A841Q0S5_9BACL|nr:CoA-binding protein [Geomicrobium halophilum]MBB6449148.1 putative CoA-binding protein [Geomicrobium halophilum]